jgi:type II secretory pathway component PulM
MFIVNFILGIGNFWNRLTLRGKLILIGVLLFLILMASGAFLVWKRINESDEALRQEQEARSQEGQIRIDEAKAEDNRAAENVNAIKNANYSNLSNDDLRQRIINAARKQK